MNTLALNPNDALISPRPRLELALCPLIPMLLLLCASLNSLFFRIIGVSLSAKGTTASVERSCIPLMDFRVFRVFRTNGPLGGPILGRPEVEVEEKGCFGGEAGRGAEGRGRCDMEKLRKST